MSVLGWGLHRSGRLASADAILWTLDRDPLLRSTIVAVALLDRAPGPRSVVDKAETLCARHPRFRSVVMPAHRPWDHPRWREVHDFDPGGHVTHVRAPEPGSVRGVLDLAQSMGTRAFDPARPLWELVLVDGLEGGRSAMVVKVHHAVIDGVGGLSVIAGVLDLDRRGPTPVPSTRAVPAPAGRPGRDGVAGLPRRLLQPGRRVVADPVNSVGRWISTISDSAALVMPSPTPCSPLMRGRGLDRYFATVDPGGDLHAAAGDAGLTLNDLFVSGILSGLSLYHRCHHQPVDRLRAVMPISTRRPRDPLETNRFVPVRLTLPAGLGTPGAYLAEVPPLLAHWKRSGAVALDEVLTVALEQLPDAAVVRLFASMLKGVDFVATDVPGPPVELFLGGARVDALLAFAPTAGAALNASLVSTAGRPHLAVAVDVAAVPDPEVLVGCLDHGFTTVGGAARRRRGPGSR